MSDLFVVVLPFVDGFQAISTVDECTAINLMNDRRLIIDRNEKQTHSKVLLLFDRLIDWSIATERGRDSEKDERR